MAEIKNLIYKDLNFHLPEKHTVTDGEIAEEVERFRKQFSEEEITDENETLNVGDTAHMDFCGYVNGEKFEGGEAKCYDLKIGSHSFIDGFEDQMVGMHPGEEKDVKVTFPENYVPDLAGKPAVFKVKLHAIKRLEFCTIRHCLNHNFISVYHVCIKAMQRLSISHHYVIRNVNNIVDGTQSYCV